MATKRIIHIDATGSTVYAVIVREADGFLMNAADGSFETAPTDPCLALAEHPVVKGRYEAAESRQAWDDGEYSAVVYGQLGGEPDPANDLPIGSWEAEVKDDEAYGTGGTAAIKTRTDKIAWQDITDLHDEAFGTWTVDPAAMTLTMKRPNGATLRVFGLAATGEAVPAFIERTPQ